MDRDRAKFLVRKSKRLFDQPDDLEIPALRVETRRRSIGEDRKFIGQYLAGRNPRGEFLGFYGFAISVTIIGASNPTKGYHTRAIALMIAPVISSVEALPPTSRVSTLPARSTSPVAARILSPAF